MKSILSINGLSLAYNGKQIVDNFSLTIESGNKVLLSGPSGRGKSSILKAILGFIIPLSGEIRIGDILLDEESVWTARRQMAYVPQNYDITTLSLSGHCHELFSFRANKTAVFDENDLLGIADRFGLDSEKVNKPFAELSGGERQRAAIVSALVLHRPLILLDEPTSALDTELKTAVAEAILSDPELTALIISHDPAWAASTRQVGL